MFEQVLSKNAKNALAVLGESGLLKEAYLAGGTALALYYGHRFSVDLDWFAENFTYSPDFRKRLSEPGRLIFFDFL